MFVWDWTWFGHVNAWQSTGTIAIVIVALFVITRMLIRFWPWLRKVMALFDALGKLPAFMSAFDALKLTEFIDRTDQAIGTIQHEVEYNNGSSVKDAVGRVEIKVDDMHTTLTAADAALRKELEDTRPSIPKPVTRTRKTKEH